MRNERGVVLVEIAFTIGVLFTFCFGIIEFGLYFRDSLTVSDSAAEGARLGAIVGPDLDVATDANADFFVIRSVRESLAGIDPERIERIVVFRGNSAGAGDPLSQIPSSCRNGTAGPRCNVYSDVEAAYVAVQGGDIDYFACPGSTVSCSWNPLTRDDGPEPADIDYLGVYIRVERPSVTGVVPDSVIERATVLRLEPGSV